jgi:hypothetical protein
MVPCLELCRAWRGRHGFRRRGSELLGSLRQRIRRHGTELCVLVAFGVLR